VGNVFIALATISFSGISVLRGDLLFIPVASSRFLISVPEFFYSPGNMEFFR
jgi:hypothetical protein